MLCKNLLHSLNQWLMEIQEIDRETALSGLLDQIPERIKKISEKRDSFLTDTVLLGEIPSPTYGEDERIRAVVDRFRENGLSAPNIDEFGNASAHLPGTEGQSSILVMAHADSVFSREVRHEIQVGSGHMSGPGIADNALGLAAMIALPRLLDDLGIRLRDDLILVANSRSLGRANLEGASGFLETMSLPARAGICVEGSTLGRLSYSGLGTLRGEITLQVPSDYDWKRFGASGAISHVTGLINQIREIPIPKEPKTQLVLEDFVVVQVLILHPSKERYVLKLPAKTTISSVRWRTSSTRYVNNFLPRLVLW